MVYAREVRDYCIDKACDCTIKIANAISDGYFHEYLICSLKSDVYMEIAKEIDSMEKVKE